MNHFWSDHFEFELKLGQEVDTFDKKWRVFFFENFPLNFVVVDFFLGIIKALDELEAEKSIAGRQLGYWSVKWMQE
jgi:hypothetical protein